MIRRVWTFPALLALLTLAGLIAALTGDGWRDALAWVALAAPVLVTLRAVRARY